MNRRNVVLLVILAGNAAWGQGNGAKSAFYDVRKDQRVDPQAPVRRPSPGLKVEVDLVSDKAVTPVVYTNHEFHSGEAVQLRLTSNVAGKLLLLLVGKDGGSKMLFPDPRINNGESSVAALKEVRVPGPDGSSIKFDDDPGVENLLAVVSSEEGFEQFGVDWNRRAYTPEETKAMIQKLERPVSTRGLNIEVDKQSASTYTVANCQPPQNSTRGMDLDVMTAGCQTPTGTVVPARVYSEIRLVHKPRP